LSPGAAPVHAQDASPTPESTVLPPDAEVGGLSLGDWSARSWQWYFSLPQDINPFYDETGALCGYGQSGEVFFLAGADHNVERQCIVPLGAHIFVPLAGAECSTVEPPPFYGGNEAELNQCVTDAIDFALEAFDMSVMTLTVDGVAVPDLLSYRVRTPLFTLWLPENNILDSAQQTADSVGEGYQVMLAPLSEGEHLIEIVVPGPDVDQTTSITYHLRVQSGSEAAETEEPAASPAAGIEEMTIDVDGRDIHAACAGSGGPTVVFEPGGPFLDGGTAVVNQLGPDLAAALGTRFCSYDRAGTGQSDPDTEEPRTFQEAAADQLAVLASPDFACPCVVIGESLGGAISLVALSTQATNFAGLVLLDPPYPGYFAQFLNLAPDSPEAGLGMDPYIRGDNEEHLDLATGFGQVTVPAEAPGIPVIVVTHGAGVPPPCSFEPPCSADYPTDEFEVAWQAGQAELAEALGARLVVAEGTGHSIATENPELVIGLVSEVIAAVIDPSSWATPVARVAVVERG
jgi:pimeloyl-ACP methyl ester carboxylesterase